jgi:3'(2'), 5'-bisphosphate nucleotidase
MPILTKLINKDDSLGVETLLRQVGRELHEHKNDPEWKVIISPTGLKTVADKKTNALMINGLKAITPNIPVYSEEDLHLISDRPITYWLIDPIDGTASWLEGYPGYVNQLALIHKNQSIYGLIYHPPTRRLWSSGYDGRVRVNNLLFKLRNKKSKIIKIIDNYPEPKGLAKHIYSKLEGAAYIECGSLGLKAILAITGEVDIFAKSTIFRDWDLAPAIAISNCLNGSITSLTGDKLAIGKSIEFTNGLLVSSEKKVIDRVIKLL